MSLVKVSKNKSALPPRVDATDASRQARWLKSAYSEHVWRIHSSFRADDISVEYGDLDFRWTMPDGTCLTEWPEFYCAVKEYAFFVRHRDYGRLNNLEGHISSVQALMNICHALALDGFTSFKNIDRTVIAVLEKRLVYGQDSLIRASHRLSEWLENRDRVTSELVIDGLPIHPRTKLTGSVPKLDAAALMAQIGLPESASRAPAVVYKMNKAAKAAGLFIQMDISGDLPEPAVLTKASLHRLFRPLELLFNMRNRIAATTPPVRPFVAGASARANELGVDPEPTPIPPADLALHLIAQAMLWVANYSGELLRLVLSARALSSQARTTRDRFEPAVAKLLHSTPKAGPEGSPWPLSRSPWRNRPRASDLGLAEDAEFASDEEPQLQSDQRPTAHQAVLLLITACFILIATFSARRLDEVLRAQVSDFRGDDDRGWEFNSYIGKTLMRKDWIPVPSIVGRAFEVLKQLCDEPDNPEGFLFIWISPFSQAPRRLSRAFGPSVVELDTFAEFVNVPEWSPDGQTSAFWHWSAHQFRKFYAILYFYRYKGATLEVLSYFLRHFSYKMTRKYLQFNKNFKSQFDRVEWDATLTIARQIEANPDGARGGLSKNLAKLYQAHLHENIKVVSPTVEQPGVFVARQMKKMKIVLTPQPWIDCGCPETKKGASLASCRSNTLSSQSPIGPNFAGAGPAVCPSCPWGIDHERTEMKFVEETLNLEKTSASLLLAGSMFEGVLASNVASAHRYHAAVLGQVAAAASS